MTKPLPLLAALALVTPVALPLATPLAAQDSKLMLDLPELTMEQETALRCGVAFAMVHNGQKAGDATLQDYPELGERGREFFVRTTARLMEETGSDREIVGMLVIREAKAFADDPQTVHDVMPACLLLLEASGI